MDLFSNIPHQLSQLENSNITVKVIIGENGSGKSSLLSNLARRYSYSNWKVIAIANTIHDKFNFTNKNFYALKASSGKYLAKRTIINSINNLAQREQQTLRSTMLALGYVGFDERIGFRIVGLSLEFERRIIDVNNVSESEKDLLISTIYRLRDTIQSKKTDLIWITDIKHSFEELYYSDLIQLFKFQLLLRQLKIITRIDVFLSRQKRIIPMLHASSGELSLITSIVYISTIINHHSVIIVDEPENSLHPKWQTEYIEKLVDIFHYYQPQILLATHSPLIISGAESMDTKLEIFKAENGSFQLQDRKPNNVEEIYSKYFDVTTPENRYISEYIVGKLNLLASKEISINSFENQMNDLRENSYDADQKNALTKIIEMGKEIVKDVQ